MPWGEQTGGMALLSERQLSTAIPLNTSALSAHCTLQNGAPVGGKSSIQTQFFSPDLITTSTLQGMKRTVAKPRGTS